MEIAIQRFVIFRFMVWSCCISYTFV